MSTGTSATTDTAGVRIRYDWLREEVTELYRTPLPSLVFRAQTVHRQFHPEGRVQTCQLLSIKTGGCPEDCAYCPQSAHYDGGVAREGLLDPEHVSGVAASAGGQRVRESLADGARCVVAGAGSMLHARDAYGKPGGATQTSWAF